MNELAIGRSVGWSIAMENFKRAVQWTKDCFKMFLICSDRLYQNKFQTVLWFVFDSSAFNEYHEWIFLALEIRFCRNTFPSEWALSQTENGIVWNIGVEWFCLSDRTNRVEAENEWVGEASKQRTTNNKKSTLVTWHINRRNNNASGAKKTPSLKYETDALTFGHSRQQNMYS